MRSSKITMDYWKSISQESQSAGKNLRGRNSGGFKPLPCSQSIILGMKLAIPPERIKEVLEKTNFCFLFAQNSHIMNRFLAPIRRQLPWDTAFDMLRPIIDYAGAAEHLIGVTDERFVEPLARVLTRLGAKRCMIVYSEDCLDEIACGGRTIVCEAIDGNFHTYSLSPTQYGLPLCTKEELAGGTPKVNAAILNDIFAGKKGPQRPMFQL